MREQEGLRADIFRSYTAAKDTQGVIRALRKYGPQEPQLYIDALAYFASSPKILEEAGDELDVVLRKIDEDGLMAPLQVIQSLSNNAVVTMGMVKRYLSSNIERERKEITTVSLTLFTIHLFLPFNTDSRCRIAASYPATMLRPRAERRRSRSWATSPSSSNPVAACIVVTH